MLKPKKWYDVYPYGTKEGDEEAKVFRALSRHQKFDYRSTGALQQETGLLRERIEEILDKYMSCDPPLIYPHPSNEEHWGYWERCPDLVKDRSKNISDKDQDGRIDKHLSGAVDMVGSPASARADDGLCEDKIVEVPVPEMPELPDFKIPPISEIKSLADLIPKDLTGELTVNYEEEGFVILDHTPEQDLRIPPEFKKAEEWVLDV